MFRSLHPPPGRGVGGGVRLFLSSAGGPRKAAGREDIGLELLGQARSSLQGPKLLGSAAVKLERERQISACLGALWAWTLEHLLVRSYYNLQLSTLIKN